MKLESNCQSYQRMDSYEIIVMECFETFHDYYIQGVLR